MLTPLLIAAVVGYVLGAIPFGYFVARAHGVNIFAVGSRNPGATNVRRTVGKGAGNTVFFLDVLKGALAAGWPWLALAVAGAESGPREVAVAGVVLVAPGGVVESAVVGLVAAVLGHSFSCFTGFRGGKGVATALGGFLVLMPAAVLTSAAVWVLAFYTSRYVSLASVLAAVALPVAAYFWGEPRLALGVSAAVALFVILRHRGNIVRLLNGTESKFVKKPKQSS